MMKVHLDQAAMSIKCKKEARKIELLLAKIVLDGGERLSTYGSTSLTNRRRQAVTRSPVSMSATIFFDILMTVPYGCCI